MMTLTEIGLKADTSGLSAGSTALDAFATVGERTDRRVKQSLDNVGKNARKAAAEAAAAAKLAGKSAEEASQKAVAASTQLDGAVNRSAGSTANLVAQWNDIGVMMAAGQNPMQLALQQGTQITQVLTQMGGGVGALKAVGSSLIALVNPISLITIGTIAAGAAAVQAFGKIGGGAVDAADQIDVAAGAVEGFGEAIDNLKLSGREMWETFGTGSDAMKGVLADMVRMKQVEAYREIDTLSESLRELALAGSWWDDRSDQSRAQDLLGLGNFGDDAREAGAEFVALFEKVTTTKDRAEQLSAAMDLRDRLKENAAGWDDIDTTQGKVYSGLLELIRNLDVMGVKVKEAEKAQNGLSDAAKAAYEVYAASRKEADAMAATAAELVKSYEAQAELNAAIAAHGEDSAEADAIRREQHAAVVAELISEKELSGATADEVMRAAMAAYDAEVNAAKAGDALTDAERAARGLASAIASAAGFSADLEGGVRVLEAEINAMKAGADAANAATIERLRIKAEESRADQIKAGEDAAAAQARYEADMAAIDRQEVLLGQKAAMIKAEREASKASTKSASAAKKALNEQEKAAKKLADAIQKAEFDADPVKRYTYEVAKLDELLKHGLSDGAYAHALAQMNQELAEQSPLISDISAGLGDLVYNFDGDFRGSFDDATDYAKEKFRRFIADMVAQSAANWLMFNVGFNVDGGGLASIAQAAQGGGGGLLGSLGSGGSGGFGGLGPIGSFLGIGASGGAGLLGGFGAAASGMMSGGLSGMMGTISAAAANTSMTLASIGTTLGAIALPVAIGAAALGTFTNAFTDFGKTTTKTSRTVSGDLTGVGDALYAAVTANASSKSTTKGLKVFGKEIGGSSSSSSVTTIDLATGNAISDTVRALQVSAMNAAEAMGVGADAFEGFAYSFTISTKGLTEDEIAAKLQEQIEGAANAFAELVPEVSDFVREGETAYGTLLALQSALSAVNMAGDVLGHGLVALSLEGGDAARSLVEIFGSASAYSSSLLTYAGLFMSDADALAYRTAGLTQTLAALGAQMPKTRAGYRAMVEAQDLNTEAGRALYATLVSLASEFDAVLPSIDAVSGALSGLLGSTLTGVDEMLTSAKEMARSAERAASDWYSASLTLRDFVGDLQAGVDGSSGTAAMRRQLDAMMAAAKGGDVAGADGYAALASQYLRAVKDQSATQVDYLRAQAAVATEAQFLAGLAETQGAAEDVALSLYEEQVTLLGEIKEAISNGTAIESDTIAGFTDQLTSLQAAIEEAELFSYDYLKERLQVAVDLIPSADIPADLAALIATAAEGVESTITFAVMADNLTPDLRWLALQGASEHIKTIDYVVGADLPNDTKRLALDTASTLTKTVSAVMGETLSPDEMRLALAGDSELSRVVNVALASDADQQAIRLALANSRAYAVTVEAALDAGDDVRRVVFGNAGAYAAMIEAAFVSDLGKAERRALLDQQGGYALTITAALHADLSDAKKRLLLNASTSAIRAITIATAFGDEVPEEQRELLLEDGRGLLNTISVGVITAGISEQGWRALDFVAAGYEVATKKINATADTGGISAAAWGFLADVALGNKTASKGVRALFDGRGVGHAGWTFLADVRGGGKTASKGVRAWVTAKDVSRSEWSFLADVRAGNRTVKKGVNGSVNLSGLTDRQKALLDVVAGSTKGLVTLGGSFQFDPTKGFESWYEAQTKANIANPMNALRSSVDELAAALTYEQRVSTAQLKAQQASDERLGAVATAQSIIDQIAQLEAQTGVQLMNGRGDALMSATSDAVRFKATSFAYGGGSDLAAFKASYYGKDGLQAQLLAAQSAFKDAKKGDNQAAKELEKILSNIPGFATGGDHLGGLRIVGERGPELEATGPARIFNASQTRAMLSGSGSSPAIDNALRQLAAAQQNVANLLERIEGSTRKTARVQERWQELGIPLAETTTAEA